jgi:hypothetical protein
MRNFFSVVVSLLFDFGLQLPWLCCGFPGTGSYPGQQRDFFFVVAGIGFLEVVRLGVRAAAANPAFA